MRTLAALALMLSFTGCAFSAPPPPGWGDDSVDRPTDPYVGPSYSDPSSLGRVEDAWVGGDMNDLGRFEGDAYGVDYVGGRYGSLRLDAGRRGGSDFGWAMIALSTSAPGGLEGDAFAPGSDTTGQVDAQGCTGPDEGDYIFDGFANDIDVTVEPGPSDNSRLFHYRADFGSEGYTEGSFVLYLN